MPGDQHRPGDRQQPERERVQPRERHVGRAEHQRDDVVAEPGERRDHEQEDHQRRVVRDQDVERLRVEELVARLRELGAEEHREHAADAEEDDRRDDVLDADHLVVGVDAEVVAPRLRTVTRVILGPRRAAARVVEPVVEPAEADEEAERRGHELDRDDHRALPDRVPAARASGSAAAIAKPMPMKIGVTQRTRSQPGAVSRRKPVGGGGAVCCVRREPGGHGGHVTRACPARYLHELFELVGRDLRAEVRRHHVRIARREVRAPGSTIDSWMKAASVAAIRLLRPPASGCRGPGRPCPVAPAGLQRVAAAAAVLLEDGEPGRPAGGLPAALQPGVELRVGEDVDVAAHQRVAETAELRADHRERAGARRRDDERVVLRPAQRPASARAAGTQNEWMTSFDVMLQLRVPALRESSASRTLLPFGYVNVHANCWPVTLTISGSEPALPFWASTIALTIEIAVTSTAGTAVQTISSFVCPCVGGPSESSSGLTRNFQTE